MHYAAEAEDIDLFAVQLAFQDLRSHVASGADHECAVLLIRVKFGATAKIGHKELGLALD